MKRIYLNHYWSLFLDFINAFQDLTYNDIPLPLLCNFYQYIDDNLKEEMMKPGFKEYLCNKELTEDQIQPHFERFLNPIKNPLKTKPIPGKVLLNFDYLRFSPNNYSENFDPQKTVIFARWKKNEHFGIPVHSIKDYIIDVTDLTQNFIEKANSIFSSYNSHPAFNNEYFRNKFFDNIPRMVEYLVAVHRYLEEVPISCIIVGTIEEIISRILIIVASAKGIPSICLQHGLLMGEEAYLPAFSTKMAVYGEYEKEWYLRKGVSEDRVSIIGHPRFDNLFTQNHMSKAIFQKEYGLNEQKKWVLLATQPHNDLFWSQLIELLVQDPLIEIIIKPHPWEIGKKRYWSYEKLSTKYETVKLILSRKINIYDILSSVDIVVASLSTIGLEAMLIKKPLIIFKKGKYSENRDYDYYDKMGDYVQSDPLKLARLVTQLLQDEKLQRNSETNRKEFLSYAYPEQLSGKRLLQLIDNLTGKII